MCTDMLGFRLWEPFLRPIPYSKPHILHAESGIPFILFCDILFYFALCCAIVRYSALFYAFVYYFGGMFVVFCIIVASFCHMLRILLYFEPI